MKKKNTTFKLLPFLNAKRFVITFSLAVGCLSILYFSFQSNLRSSQFITNTVDFSSQGSYDSSQTNGVFLSSGVVSHEQADAPHAVLGDTTQEKRIEVDLSQQRLYAFEGDHKIYDFLISSGKWGRTPTGEFTIWSKFRYTKMSGGSKELRTYYYLPNVPYVMFFSNAEVAGSRGFSLHGTYWHENFGHPMSHGCINMKTEEAGLIYDWSSPSLAEGQKSGRTTADNPGTKIIIYGEAPQE